MVSTRQSSNVVGGNDNTGGGIEQCPTKIVRHVNIPPSTEPSPGTSNSEPEGNKTLNLLDLPVEILETIFGYLSYKNIADLRLVSRKVDSVCCTILNTTFQRLQAQMLNRFQSIKAKMPRRESARRTHPLACESDIIETLHMRLTLLQMTFGKHIERHHCCFFAGEILDEVYRVLNYIKVTPVPLARPYKVTDELFDLSTMAMEYFKERIEPTLPEIAYFGTELFDFTSFSSAGGSSSKSYISLDSPTSGKGYDASTVEDIVESPPQSNMVLRKRIRKIKQGMKRYNSQLSVMRRDLRICKNRMADQQKQILEYASRLDETDKKNEETSRKFSTLLQELNKCKTELQYWRSKSPANPLVCTCGKVLTPVPNEDLQALVNQGVVPEGLSVDLDSEGGALAISSLEPPSAPVAGTSGEQAAASEQCIEGTSPEAIELCHKSGTLLKLIQASVMDTLLMPILKSDKDLQPLSPQPCSSKPCGSKRKITDESVICHESKKTRRSKRSKV